MEKKPVSPFRLMVGGKTWREWRKEFNVDRKPVFCAHPSQAMMPSQDGHDFVCHVCGIHWPYEAPADSLPKVQIGYTEAGEDGGKT